jgi:hypothetical protein
MLTSFSDSVLKKAAFEQFRYRRGSTLTGLLAALGIVGTFAAVVYVLVPTGVHGGASSVAAKSVQARHESNQLLIESLAALIGHSAEVVAVHPRTASPYKEIVLRLQDSSDVDGVPAEDIAVISHSSVLHTIMFYSLESDVQSHQTDTKPGMTSEGTSATEGGIPGSRARSADSSLASARSSSPASSIFTRSELAHPGFCDRWRSNPHVKPRLIARGISDMQVKTIDQPSRGSTLQLSLTWSPDSADGGDTAAVLISAVINSSPPPQFQ